MTSQRSGPGDARDCAVTRGEVPAPLTSGPSSGRALVRRREEPAQAHAGGMRSFPPRVLRGARLTLAPWAGGKEPKMAAAGARATRLLLLLLMAATAPSRARGSGCRSGAAARGVSTHWRGRQKPGASDFEVG